VRDVDVVIVIGLDAGHKTDSVEVRVADPDGQLGCMPAVYTRIHEFREKDPEEKQVNKQLVRKESPQIESLQSLSDSDSPISRLFDNLRGRRREEEIG